MQNAGHLLDERLPAPVRDVLVLVARAAEQLGTQAYLVGGSVRDLLNGSPTPADLDITLVGATSETFSIIAKATGGVLTKSSQFRTARIRLGDTEVDLAMARSECYPEPGSLPVVRPGTLAEDMARRDFSINAMAVSLSTTDWGKLFDPHGGVGDLANRRLHILHALSFQDDATRIIRAARYAARLSLEPTNETRDSLTNSLGYLTQMSAARVRNELERCFAEGAFAPGAMRLLAEWRALSAIHPDLRFRAPAWERFGKRLGTSQTERRIGVAYALVGAYAGPNGAASLATRLGVNALHRRVLRESQDLASLIASLRLSEWPNSRLADLLDPLDSFTVIGATLSAPGPERRRFRQYLAELRALRTQITGDDLMALGMRPGPGIGRVLALVRRARLDGDAVTRDDELALAKRLMSAND